MRTEKSYTPGGYINTGTELPVPKAQNTAKKVSAKTGRRPGGKLSVRRNISASSYLMRVAAAKTSSQVSAVIRCAKADLRFVKSCNTEQSDVAKAVRIIKKVIAKSRLKINRLKAEAAIEKQMEQAQLTKQKELAEKLIKKRRARKAQETADAGDMEQAKVVRTQEVDDFSAEQLTAVSSGIAASVTLTGEADCILYDSQTADNMLYLC